MGTVKKLKQELDDLTDYRRFTCDKRVQAVIAEIRKEDAPRVAEIEAQLAAIHSGQKEYKRWPDNTPPDAFRVCERYWNGTTEFSTFRIHQWNDKAVWTSYPSGGYSTNGGWIPTPSCYYLLSLTENDSGFSSGKPKILKELSFPRNSGRRVTKKIMQEELDKL
jgi:hypothetical protein